MDEIDVIEAFVDGEPVDPSALKAALAAAEARDHLVDILILRGLVGGSAPSRAGGAAPSSTGHGWARWAPAAAVIALVGGITGYLAGTRSSGPAPSVAVAPTAVVAPAPTEVIHLRSGVDWTERRGGR